MALDIPRLQAALVVGFRALYNFDNMNDPANEGNEFYTIEQMSLIIARCVIEEFVNNAQCDGADSHGDSHGAVGII